LKSLSAAELGSFAIRGAIQKAGVDAAEVEYVIMGQVLQAGSGQNAARQAAAKAGISMQTPSITINKVCLSGLDAIALADQLIRAGEFDCIVAGGMESMSNAPHLMAGSREGVKFGDWTMADSIAVDALSCAFDEMAMGLSVEKYSARHPMTREHQDAVSALSHQRAARAADNGVFDEEIVSVEVRQAKGELILISRDEGIRSGTTVEGLAKLRPAFKADGSVTAGNASQISDGAAAVVVMSRKKALELGLTWLAEIGAHGNVAGPDGALQVQPSNAIIRACEKEQITIKDIDLFEINEAFAAVSIASSMALGLDEQNVNVNGGAIALGHPVGMSGARLALHGALEQKRRGGGIVAVALCGGGGQGSALLLRV
jgi:acetyl-CoA C-acetyltransferase